MQFKQTDLKILKSSVTTATTNQRALVRYLPESLCLLTTKYTHIMASPQPDAPVGTLPDSEHSTLEASMPEPSRIQTSAPEERQDSSNQRTSIDEQSLDPDMVIGLLKEIMQKMREAQACLDELLTFKSDIKRLARGLQAELSAVQNENTTLRSEMTAVQIENATLRNEMSAVQAENNTLRAGMTAVQAENTAMRAENNTLRNEMSAVRNENNTLRTEMIAVQTENSTLRTEMSAVQTENNTLRAEIATLHAENATLRADMIAVKTEMTAMRADVAVLRTIVSNLTTRVATR